MDIVEESISHLGKHAEIPIAFVVDKILQVSLIEGGLGGLRLNERVVAQPWPKDYDAIKGEGPTRWAKRFDVSNWGLIAAHNDRQRVGGAVIAFDTPALNMLEGRDDLALLWDMRVRPDRRSGGVGTLLFRAVEDWARDRGCRLLKVETQNINVPACHFYRRMGCTLASVNTLAYPDLPGEVQLVWAKQLEAGH